MNIRKKQLGGDCVENGISSSIASSIGGQSDGDNAGILFVPQKNSVKFILVKFILVKYAKNFLSIQPIQSLFSAEWQLPRQSKLRAMEKKIPPP